MATEQSTESSSSLEQIISPSAWMLTESHEFLKNVLSCLPAVELVKCARVCKQWRKEVTRILNTREHQLAWASYNYNTTPARSSEHTLGYFGENLEECIQSLQSVPQHVLMFTELVTRADYTSIGTKQWNRYRYFDHSAHDKIQSEIASTINLIQQQLPQKCSLLCLQTSGTIGTYPDLKLLGESEKGMTTGGATAVLFPSMEGVDIKLLKVTVRNLCEDDILETLGLVQNAEMPLKCVLLFGHSRHSTAVDDLAVDLQSNFKEKQGTFPVIAGGLVRDVLSKQQFTKKQLDSNVIGMTFAGPNVQAASVILGHKVHKREQVKQKLQQLKKLNLCEKKSMAFMFGCIDRGAWYYGEKNVERSVFRELFPNTPLFGFDNGNFGCDNLTCGTVDDETSASSKCSNRTQLPDIIQARYTTIFCFLSFGKPS